jgi:Flp pilus assembly protein TadG
MMLRQIYRDTRGATAVEFAMTAPVFIAMLFGIIQLGSLLWTQLGLQHGVEMAARCASVNTTVCGNTASIQNYAVGESFGLNPPASTFTVTAASCGNQVNANYTYQFLRAYFPWPSLTLGARSCFPT